MSNDSQRKVQNQFGASAHDYATSQIHAYGESLLILRQQIEPRPNWQVLDVATGAGHTAFTFAPHAARVIALDLTWPMLTKTSELARQHELTNVSLCQADSQKIPLASATFDLVSCRLAFHHFPDRNRAVAEWARVLKVGGTLGFTDNFVVNDPECAHYYNKFEVLRDPSHCWVHPLEEIEMMLKTHGLQPMFTRQLVKQFEFHAWADRQRVPSDTKKLLLDMMRNAPDGLLPLFSPQWTPDSMYFNLWEAVIVARKVAIS